MQSKATPVQGTCTLLHAFRADCVSVEALMGGQGHAGKDATEDFEYYGHSDKAREQMAAFLVGEYEVRCRPMLSTQAGRPRSASSRRFLECMSDDGSLLSSRTPACRPALIASLSCPVGLVIVGAKAASQLSKPCVLPGC
jgi:hypothetical protein